ncbi:ArsR/SmtB family transcription factor [Paratissierella segnis]|uniref:Winged helix-turn-helix transcriptional regulator n=1 Tax=Paratissierella segnis TaxID=2763679 RepID=A0A926EY60_9FIRM|nr:metalloregulator ArsR/SmtB family transcription factor [Paratissierella segnis]MBC8588559.1 winged helix-turn-helix transcriptional regulator [Paratissierella segnis]
MRKDTEDKYICPSHATEESQLDGIKCCLEKEKDIEFLSTTFKAMSDPTRLKIIYALSKSSLCVCDIASILDMTQSAISHHLRILRDLNLVKSKREGKLVIYSLDDEHVLGILELGLVHAKHR